MDRLARAGFIQSTPPASEANERPRELKRVKRRQTARTVQFVQQPEVFAIDGNDSKHAETKPTEQDALLTPLREQPLLDAGGTNPKEGHVKEVGAAEDAHTTNTETQAHTEPVEEVLADEAEVEPAPAIMTDQRPSTSEKGSLEVPHGNELTSMRRPHDTEDRGVEEKKRLDEDMRCTIGSDGRPQPFPPAPRLPVPALVVPFLKMEAPPPRQVWAAVQDLVDQTTMLRHSLELAGILRWEASLAELHRGRFEAARQTYPAPWEGVLEQSVEPLSCAQNVVSFLGPRSAGATAAASHGLLNRVSIGMQSMFTPSICVCGGEDGSVPLGTAECLRESPGDVQNMWEEVPSLGEPRAFAMAAVLDGCLHVCGGSSGAHSLRSIERLNPVDRTWEVLPQMECARYSAVTAVVNGCLYVCGGADESSLREVERWNPSESSWEVVAPMIEKRASAVAAVLDGHLYVCGGRDGQHVHATSERFNPANGTWELLPSRQQGRAFAVGAIITGRLYICGGATSDGFLASAECFDPKTSAWEDLPRMREARGSAAAAAMFGQLIVCGGHNGELHLRTVERFDPVARTWEGAQPMCRGRINAAAAVLAGSLYVCGGDAGGDEVLSAVERYDPAEDAWEALMPMKTPRCAATATAMLLRASSSAAS
eukprot:TRINITY_DN68801_c0_g1_i1.p1 TRINITY_DN68801_c0_g1~~TRINITY_DN68801_c0_g1_i1.p1  ORF type:complete len:682 (-),score=102.94 TRINITY_DN68801_c0_g1_i1:228-2189(-)